MRTKLFLKFGGLLVAGSLMACVSTGPVARKSDGPADMALQYADRARSLESSGDIVEAAHYYKLALTVDPEDQAAAESLARVENRRRLLADEYYQSGLDLYARGKYADSRQALLIALRLQPDHGGALEKLTTRNRILAKRFILHKVQSGESISTIAKRYYGDPRQYELIARYNNLPDATQIRLGLELKIPQVDGLPFYVDEQSQQIQTEAADAAPLTAWPAEETESYEEPIKGTPVQNQVASYRQAGLDLLREKQYDAAIVEFNKVLSAQPDDEEVKGHIYKAHYDWAHDLMREKKYLSAKDQFERCLALNSSCQQCHGYITQCESAYKEMHYQRGIQFFGAEKPDEAITEWEMVRQLDPGYKQVGQYIDKAKKISNNIKKLKQQTN